MDCIIVGVGRFILSITIFESTGISITETRKIVIKIAAGYL